MRNLSKIQVDTESARCMSKLPEEEKDQLWIKEFCSGKPRALIRANANQLFHVCYPEGVDDLADRARSLFDAIPESSLTIDPESSDRDLFYKAVKMWMVILQLAVINGRPDLERIGEAVNFGLIALEEREKGFDEPLLHARKRSRKEPRDTHYVRQLKAISGLACSDLVQYGMTNAAIEIARLINRGGFLPPKQNGKAITAKSVSNWQWRRWSFRWSFLPEMNRFDKASLLWHEGHREAAQQAVLRELSERLKKMKRTWMEA
jgi:hypothetical protein